MSGLSMFCRRDCDTREAWGHIFQWTPDHQTPEQYNHLKYTYDKLGEDCANILNEYRSTAEPSPSPAPTPSSGKEPSEHNNASANVDGASGPAPKARPKPDLYVLLRDRHHEHEKLQQLWDEVTNVPDWVDWEQIERGQMVFDRYGVAATTGLTYQSLLGGTGSDRVVEVLARTGGFSIKAIYRRLLETTQYVLQCTQDLDSIKPGGDGFASCLRVRLLHSTVRARIMRLAATRPEYYSVEKNGIPVNDLDSIGTIAVFSATVLWQSLPRQGIYPRQQEILDYLALWRLIAYYLGTPTDQFATPTKAKAIMESLLMYEYSPSDTSRLHARNIIRALENKPPIYASRAYLEGNARWLNGGPLADALGLRKPPVSYYVLTAGHCLLYMSICYTCRTFAPLDRWQRRSFRRALWAKITSPDYGLEALTTFEFKYIPGYGRRTKDEGDFAEKKPNVLWTADRRAAATLLVAALATYVTIWMSGRTLLLVLA